MKSIRKEREGKKGQEVDWKYSAMKSKADNMMK